MEQRFCHTDSIILKMRINLMCPKTLFLGNSVNSMEARSRVTDGATVLMGSSGD